LQTPDFAARVDLIVTPCLDHFKHPNEAVLYDTQPHRLEDSNREKYKRIPAANAAYKNQNNATM
jgi:hypothetical protein